MATGERAMKAFTLQELAERVKERAAASPANPAPATSTETPSSVAPVTFSL